MFPEVEPREILRFEGNKINCFPKDQSLSDLLYSQRRHHPRGGGYSQKNWVGVYGPHPKTLTLFMTKISNFSHPIYDLTKNLIPYL